MVSDDNAMHVPLPEEYVCDEFISRRSEDKTINTNRHLLIEFCKQTSLIILNGRCGAEKHSGKFTFNSYARQSVIDYVLVSPKLYKHIDEFSVDDPNIISDHSILRLIMPISVATEETDTQEDVFESVTINMYGKVITYE